MGKVKLTLQNAVDDFSITNLINKLGGTGYKGQPRM